MKTINECTKNDIIILDYGFEREKFRIKKVLNDAVEVHMLTWCKCDAIVMSFLEIKKRDYFYYGRMSKFRALFLI